jgi:2-phosphosulfolactate phosphatase
MPAVGGAVYADQHRWRVRFDWGPEGLSAVGDADVVVIVDVLSFCTAVDVAVSRGAAVIPVPKGAPTPLGALVAVGRREVTAERPWSLSPASLETIPSGTELVLPSPNGAALSALATASRVLAGCLRNASAVARACGDAANVAVIAAGERWPEGSLRPAIEDLCGAGAILSSFPSEALSPEAAAAVGAWRSAPDLRACASARELIERGYRRDVELALAVDVSECVPERLAGAFRSPGRARTRPATPGT